MTTPSKIDNEWFRCMEYGCLWLIIHPQSNVYAAIGNSGNVIYINPEKNVVIAVSSYFKPTVFDRIDFIEETILASLPSKA